MYNLVRRVGVHAKTDWVQFLGTSPGQNWSQGWWSTSVETVDCIVDFEGVGKGGGIAAVKAA